MTGARRFAGMVMAGTLAVLAAFWLAPARAADETPRELSRQQEQEKRVRDNTDHMVRRISTMLRVLDYYQLDQTDQKHLLDEVAGTLSGLSREQMAEVIARLESASKTPDGNRSREEVERAYERHREIVLQLKAILARYEAVKDLDQAAQRLDKAGKDQLERYLQTSQLGQDWQDLSHPRGPAAQRKNYQTLATETTHEADEQGDLRRDVGRLFQQMAALEPLLPAEQKERLKAAQSLARERDVLENLLRASDRLHALARGGMREPEWKAAADLQRQASADLQDLARVLRTPRDRLADLREAREQLDRAIQAQEELRQESHDQQDPRVQDRQKQQEKQAGARRSQELGDRQGRLEHATHEVQNLLRPHEEQLANKVTPAEKAMTQAEQALRKEDPAEALKPQGEAADTLREVRKDVERLIAEAEQQQRDPLAALQKAEETVGRLLKEQQDAHDKAKEAETTQHPDRLAPLAPKQQDLAKRTEDLKDQPLPSRPQVQPALEKAEKAMENAAQALHDKKGPEAVAAQEEALRSLEEAQKDISEQRAEVEKRRQEIAALEDAEKKLGELAKKEGQVADKAHDLDGQPAGEPAKKEAGAKELGSEQGKLTPQAKEVGKQVEGPVPEAGQKVGQAAEHMEAAQHDLEQQEPSPAAGKAEKAAGELEEARKAVAKALEERKGAEIADQAAMEKEGVDPANAARQVAKALEEAKEAAEESEQAAAHLGQKPEGHEPTPDLAKLQRQVAEKANQMKLEAATPADEAAKALQKGELAKAIEQQEQALARLEEAAQQEEQAPAEKRHAKEGHEGQHEDAGQKKEGEHAGEKKEGQPEHSGEHAGAKKESPKEGEHSGEKKGPPKEGEHSGEKKSSDHEGHEGHEGNHPKEGQHEGEHAGQHEGQKEGHAGKKEGGEGHGGKKEGEEGHAGSHEGQEGEPHGGQPSPAEAKNAGELAQAQQALLEATKALAKSQEANEAAMAALGQAQAQAPAAVQPPLKQAGEELGKAGQELAQSAPASAHQSQAQAVAKLSEALQSLNSALAAMGQHPAKPSESSAQGKPGEKALGMKLGQPKNGAQAAARQRAPSNELMKTQGTGNRMPDGRVSNTPSQLRDVSGDGSFLHLPPRQREMILQALNGKLPPEYSALIQQYYVNIARGKPAARPAPPEKK